jgi:putative MFS transporter
VGRFGSIVGPYLVGLIIPVFGKPGVFTLGAISFFIAAIVVATLGIETKGKTLEEISH